jgi:hypothetical protein
MPRILGNSPGIAGRSNHILWPDGFANTITCGFSELRACPNVRLSFVSMLCGLFASSRSLTIFLPRGLLLTFVTHQKQCFGRSISFLWNEFAALKLRVAIRRQLGHAARRVF